jgi:hypothetical protein
MENKERMLLSTREKQAMYKYYKEVSITFLRKLQNKGNITSKTLDV